MTPTIESQQVDELLEAIFTEREEGRDASEGVLAHAAGHPGGGGGTKLPDLERAGLVRLHGPRVTLTAAGERRAADLVRRHRLTERLFRDVLQLSDAATETQACELEHILSPEATASVCALLGHPPTCPHGKAIPPGPCCATTHKTLKPLVTGLRNLELGANARIVFIAPKFHDRMDRLAALGVIPGSDIRLHQRAPSYVIDIGETTLALDSEIAAEIYVKPL